MQKTLAMSDNSGANTAVSILKFAAGAVLIVGLVGTSLFPINGISGSSGPQTVKVRDESGRVVERGALSRMTRPEIQDKLSQVPVFYLKDKSGGMLLEGGVGTFYMNPQDASERLAALGRGDDAQVSATSLDDVYFPLLAPATARYRGPNATPAGASVSEAADPKATYRLLPKADQVAEADKLNLQWKNGEAHPVPLWVCDRLAFRGKGRTKIPLFTNVKDLYTSWQRLLDSKDGGKDEPPVVKLTTLDGIVGNMATGGSDSRMLEFFADIEAIDEAEKLTQ